MGISGLPLRDIRVIELGAFIAGPYCGQLLADFGADVIKVEPPGAGDPMREWGLHKVDGMSLWWPVIGRNKRSITLDLRTKKGQDLARQLICSADVLVENFRPGTLEGWNLDPKNLCEDSPGLVVARVSGFGQTGPYRERAGFAAVCEAMAGLRFLTGYPDRPPTRVGISIGDSLAGIFAALGVLTALYAREQGKGQIVDVSIAESVLAVLESVVSEYSVTGQIRERFGPVLPGVAPSNLYPTADESWVMIAANADGLFCRLAKAMARPELAQDPRFATHTARGKHQQELDHIVSQWTGQQTRSDLLELLHAENIPAGAVYNAADVANDPHYREREAIIEVDTTSFGRVSMQGVFPKLSETPGSVRWEGPRIGEHNKEVFQELMGLSDAEFTALISEHVI